MIIIKEILKKLRTIIEIYIPSVTFSMMFITFVIQTIARYVFKHQLSWTNEIITFGFCWTSILGACYAMRVRSHITFPLLYDLLPKKIGIALCMIGNAIIIIFFSIIIIPSFDFIKSMSVHKTPILKIPTPVLYSPFLYFLLSSIMYSISDMRKDFLFLLDKLIKNGDRK